MISFRSALLFCLLPCLFDALVSLTNHSKGHRLVVSSAEDFHKHNTKLEAHPLVVPSAGDLHLPNETSSGRSHLSIGKLPKGMSFLQSGYARALHPGQNKPKQLWGLPKIIWVIMVDVFAMMVFLACIPIVLSCAKKKRPALK